MLAAAFLLSTAGAGVPLASTYAAIAAVLFTLLAITVNTYTNAAPDRPMGRLLHDPEPDNRFDVARQRPASSRRGPR